MKKLYSEYVNCCIGKIRCRSKDKKRNPLYYSITFYWHLDIMPQAVFEND